MSSLNYDPARSGSSDFRELFAAAKDGSKEQRTEAQRQQDEQRLESAIKKLEPEQQSVIRLRHQEKLSFAEIGKAMDRSVEGIRMLWNRAIEQLSKELNHSE